MGSNYTIFLLTVKVRLNMQHITQDCLFYSSAEIIQKRIQCGFLSMDVMAGEERFSTDHGKESEDELRPSIS